MTESSSSPVEAPLPQSPRTPTSGGLRGPWGPVWVFVGAVLVAVILLGAAFLGAFGGGTSGGGRPPGPVTYLSAQASAATVAPPIGTWTLVDAVGIDLANATSLPLNFTGIANCWLTSLVGPIPSAIPLPSFHGNLLRGLAQTWLLAYLNPTTDSEMEAVVTGGVVTLAWEGSGASCIGYNGTAVEGVPSSVVDSSVAASAAGSVGAAAFLASHPTGVSLVMDLSGGNQVIDVYFPPVWSLDFTTCSNILGPNGPQSPGATFGVKVNATTGWVVPGSESNSSCGVSPPPPVGIVDALTLGPASLFPGPGTSGTVSTQGCVSGDSCYRVPIFGASDNLTPGDFELEVVSVVNLTVFPAVGYAILNATGQVLVYSTGADETAWTSGVGTSTALLTFNTTIVVDMGTGNPSGWKWSLQITGTGPFTNSQFDFGLP